MTCCGQDNEVLDACHNLADGDVGNDIFLAVIEKRVFVEVDPTFVDSTFSEGIADPLTEHDSYHNREDIGESSSELKHDYYDGHCHSCNSAECCGCTNDGICSWSNAGNIRFASCEWEECGVVVDPNFHDDANSSSEQSSNRHRRQNDASGDLKSKSDRREKEAKDSCKHE